jgi:hypothetical protein
MKARAMPPVAGSHAVIPDSISAFVEHRTRAPAVANHLARVFRTWAEPNVERTHLTHWCLVDLLTGISLRNLFR